MPSPAGPIATASTRSWPSIPRSRTSPCSGGSRPRDSIRTDDSRSRVSKPTRTGSSSSACSKVAPISAGSSIINIWIMPYRGWANAEPRMRTSSGVGMILREDAGMRTGPTRRRMLALIGSLAPAAALADSPDRRIRLVVALAPGGPPDPAARLFAPYFSERLGQSVVIENRTGASSVVGTESVVRAPPDGYTLLFGSSSSFAVNPAVMKNLRFDVRKDLTLVGRVSYTPHGPVVRGALPARALAELIALAKAPPGQLRYASSGAGGSVHLASVLFKREAGVDIVHVPYRGGGPAVMGLLTGAVDIF